MAKKKLVEFRFDDAIEAAVTAAQKEAGKMVADISKATEQAIADTISRAIRDNMSPDDAADLISDVIGLSTTQASALANYRERLEAQGLDPEKVEDLVETYADKLIDDRAEAIARTEIMDALNNGASASLEAAQEEGFLSPNATKEWIVTDDDRLCSQCEPYDGKTVPVGEEFPEGDPPLHPYCRCVIAIGEP